jgi:hypothetical protein
MRKAMAYISFVVAFIIASGILLFILYGVWLYWNLNNSWGTPN